MLKSINCEYFKQRIEDYISGKLSEEERELFLKHKQECDKCFYQLVSREPSQVFSRLATKKIQPSFWQDFWPAIKDGIEKKHLSGKWFISPRRLGSVAALIISFLIICGALVWFYVAPRIMLTNSTEEISNISLKVPKSRLNIIEELRSQYSVIEYLESKDARLYTFKIEEGMEVVMIFDEKLNEEK
jgi:hypothetical protein